MSNFVAVSPAGGQITTRQRIKHMYTLFLCMVEGRYFYINYLKRAPELTVLNYQFDNWRKNEIKEYVNYINWQSIYG